MHSPSKNIFWLSVSRIAALGLLFFAYRELFRYLGPFTSGQHQFVLSYITIFGVIVDFGIQQYIVKKMSEEPQAIKKYFQNFLAIEIILAFAVYGAALTLANLNGYDHTVRYAIALAGLGMAIHALTYPFLAVLTAMQDLKKVAALNFLQAVINVSIIVSTIVFNKSIVFLVSNQLIYGAIALFIYTHLVKKHIPHPEINQAFNSLDGTVIKKTIKAALPFALLVGFSTIYNRIDIVIITKLLGFVQTGLYGAAYKVFDLLAFFPAVVSHTLYPLFAGFMAQQARDRVQQQLEQYLRFLIALALPIGVGGSILARPLIIFLAGPDYAEGASALAILIWASVILFMYIVANALVISQLTKFAVMITGANVIINILGNLLLIPYLGIRGAALMTVISELIQGSFYFYFIRKKITHFRLFGLFVKPLLAAAIMGLVVWQMKDSNLLIALSSGMLTYAAVLISLRFFTTSDLAFLKNFFKTKPITAA
jgi:O-antigen/teichoic acid export membrane protein